MMSLVWISWTLDVSMSMSLCFRRIIWVTDKTYGSDQHIGKNENQGLSEITWAEKIE